MLQEHTNVRQNVDEPRRRFFSDDYFELFVWFGQGNEISQFELSYDICGDWRAIRWSIAAGCQYYRVDDTPGPGRMNATPILRTTPAPDPSILTDILEKFKNAGQSIEQQVADFVHDRLR